MATLKEAAKEFVPKQTKNIAELPEVSVDVVVKHDGRGTDNEGKTFTYSYIEINGEEYRVPDVVLKDLKTIIEAKPNITKISVKRTGEGLKTRYTVIPL